VTAADLAAVRSELAEDNKLVRTDFNSLEQRFEVLSKNQQQLSEALRRAEAENRSLREALAKATVGLATRKDLEQVLDQLKEVDKKRVDDGRSTRESLSHLGEQLEKVAKLAATPVAAPPEERRKPKPEPERTSKHEEATPDLPSEFYEHTIQEGESLGVILNAYNKEHGLKVKVQDVLKANPKLKDPKKLFVGMKLRIPVVK
jgi:chromosome segregation ATPase